MQPKTVREYVIALCYYYCTSAKRKKIGTFKWYIHFEFPEDQDIRPKLPFGVRIYINSSSGTVVRGNDVLLWQEYNLSKYECELLEEVLDA